jgi:hypothetical protein
MLGVGSVIAAAAFSYVFYRLGTKERRPVYMKTGNRVVAGGGEIEVLFAGESVARVTKTLVFFWNAGRESIRSEDVREPVILRVLEGRLLRATVVKATRTEIRPSLQVDGETAVLEFSHLDRTDGCCVEVMHTGENVLGVSVSSVIVGVRSGPRFLVSPFWDDPVGVWIGLATAVGGVALMVGAVVAGSWPYAVVASAAFALGLRMAASSRRRDKRYLPREFWDLPIPQNPRATGGVTGWRLNKRG